MQKYLVFLVVSITSPCDDHIIASITRAMIVLPLYFLHYRRKLECYYIIYNQFKYTNTGPNGGIHQSKIC